MATAAQEEFDKLVASNTHRDALHPEDRDDQRSQADSEPSEDELYRNAKVDAAMRMSTAGPSGLKLPPASFDSGRSTGVKGVIADARSYESARKSKLMNRARASTRASIFSALNGAQNGSKTDSETDEDVHSGGEASDEEEFLQQWREARRRELESEASRGVRTRRTSPSVRIYGRMDEVDAMGYLDAIEKVGRETTVVVFVYDHECEVSATIESAILPLVKSNPSVHFVRIHYEEIEFDNAAVPAILAYRNQGDLVANLTGIIEIMPDDESFGPESLEKIFKNHGVL